MEDSMSINTIMLNAMNTDFQQINDFKFIFGNVKFTLDSVLSNEDIWDICAMTVDTAATVSNVQPTLLGGSYRIHTAKYQPFTFSVSFRDVLGLDLKRYFTKIWQAQQRQYFDDIKSSVALSVEGVLMFQSYDCLIASISPVQMDNSNIAIAEFTVEFISPYHSSADFADFGKPGVKGP